MDIYVGHSSSIDYHEELYQPLRESDLDDEHNLVLPHEGSEELFDSRTFLRETCDVFVAEVSEASTGLGIELGWADVQDVAVICVHREGTDPSGSLKAVTDTVEEYSDTDDLVETLARLLQKL
jgi:hypothetical protein